MSAAATESSSYIETRADGTKIRPCLTCQVPFESSWVGERICRQCKCKSTWKNGAPLDASRPRNHSRGSSSK